MEKRNTEEKKRGWFARRFAPKRLALIAVFAALSYLLSFLEFPIFPAAPFLKLDFGNVLVMLMAFLLGPVEGVVVCLVKECFRLIGSGTGGVGEIANFLVTCAYLLFPSILYLYKKKLSTVIISLCVASVLATGAALLANRFILFPLFFGDNAAAGFAANVWFVLAFNLIKAAAVSLLTVLLYKRLSYFFKKWKV